MLPYIETAPFIVGPLTISPFGVTVALTLITWLGLLLWRATAMGLDPRRALHLFECVVLAGLVAAAGVPWAAGHGGYCSLGGALGAAISAALFLFVRRLPLIYLDLLTWIFPFGWALLRLGCYLIHDHPGRPTDSWLAVRYPGGTRYDLGALEMLACIALACTFLMLGRRQRPAGYFLRWVGVFGLLRMLIGLAREDPPRYYGLTADQIGGLALLGVGVWAAGWMKWGEFDAVKPRNRGR